MKDMQFAVQIYASKEKVWDTLWQDETFQQWASVVDPQTYKVGDLKVGSELQFFSAVNGYGVTSLVEELTENEFLLLRHQADTQNTGARTRVKEWTGGTETYLLAEKDGVTSLTVKFDVPVQMEEMFNVSYPKALEMVKVLAEKSKTETPESIAADEVMEREQHAG